MNAADSAAARSRAWRVTGLLALLALTLAATGWARRHGVPVLPLRFVETAAWASALLLLPPLLDLLLWDRLVSHDLGRRLPRLLRQCVALLAIAIGLGALLNQVWGVTVATVLATTGVLGLVLGLALRPILTDLFSGIALNLEQPFRIGDFVSIRPRSQRNPVVGTVREITWRSTRVLTPEDNLISVPNSVAAAAIVENLSYPSPVSEQEIDVTLAWEAPTARVESVLQAAVTEAWAQGATAGERAPTVRLLRLDGEGVTWRIVYLLDPRRKPRGPARHVLLGCVRQHLRAAGLQPAPAPGGEAAAGAAAPRPLPDPARADDRERLLREVPLLAMLDDGEHAGLAAAVAVREIGPGVAVVTEGETDGGAMYVVAGGTLEVLRGGARIGALGPGTFFGERAMLTGDPRAATVRALTPAVLYEVPRAAMASLLQARPALAEQLSAVLQRHQRADAERDRAAAAAPPPPAESLAQRMRRFLRLPPG